MTTIVEAIHRENALFNAVINVVLAVVLGGICIAIPAYGAAALESEILGIVTYIMFIAALGFVACVIVYSLLELYRETQQSDGKRYVVDESDKISDLRNRYTQGEINEQELEVKMEGILNDVNGGDEDESEAETEHVLTDVSEKESTDQNARQ